MPRQGGTSGWAIAREEATGLHGAGEGGRPPRRTGGACRATPRWEEAVGPRRVGREAASVAHGRSPSDRATPVRETGYAAAALEGGAGGRGPVGRGRMGAAAVGERRPTGGGIEGPARSSEREREIEGPVRKRESVVFIYPERI